MKILYGNAVCYHYQFSAFFPPHSVYLLCFYFRVFSRLQSSSLQHLVSMRYSSLALCLELIRYIYSPLLHMILPSLLILNLVIICQLNS